MEYGEDEVKSEGLMLGGFALWGPTRGAAHLLARG